MIAKGLLAGAAGTLALDAYTYGDMLLRGRPSSEVPADVVRKLAKKLGMGSLAKDDCDAAKNRRSGAGALSGYGVGLGAGIVYCAVRPVFQSWLPWPLAGALLGAATLVASEGGATALGATDWRTWSAADWAADIVPRTLYGLMVAYVCENIAEDDS